MAALEAAVFLKPSSVCYARNMGKSSVLIIEDDENVRELYAFALAKAGFEIIKAKDGGEGVRLALKEHPDLILVDIIMPVLDGHKVVKEIREDSWGKKAKIIYLTNKEDVVNVVYAKELEAEDYIIKANTDVQDLVEIIKKHL